MNDTIRAIRAREVLDSRGHPTVEVDVHCADGTRGRAMVPSGASTGKHEAVELRDGDASRYQGKGVRHAVRHIHEVFSPQLIGRAASDQEGIDRLMIDLDGTPTKSRLGANAILGISLAIAHAAAASRGVSLWRYLDRGQARMPLPMVNLISGGLHAGKNLEFQDFLFMPIGAGSYSQSLEWTVAVYRALGTLLREGGHEGVLVGDEGGFGPKLANNEQALEFAVAAIEKAGLKPGIEGAIALDVASTHFFENGAYRLRDGDRNADELARMLEDWTDRWPIVSIEDGMAEDDWTGWKSLTDRLGKKVQLVGDDLFVTNPQRLQRGIEDGIANAVLVKVNQIGTLTETFAVLDMARAAGYRAVVSARSGETEDATLADLAVASGAGQIKIGSIARSERLAKYNQLLRIEEEMGPNAPFAMWG
jgi:enolase